LYTADAGVSAGSAAAVLLPVDVSVFAVEVEAGASGSVFLPHPARSESAIVAARRIDKTFFLIFFPPIYAVSTVFLPVKIRIAGCQNNFCANISPPKHA
jgi:hypothetical protein